MLSDSCCLSSSLLMCFFFFKQKTAYEMRISDWSSDVCSSDLAPLEPGEAGAVLAERGEPCLQIVRGPDGLLQFLHRIVGGEHALVRGDIGKLLGRGKIGRASCRERVCQYV